MLRAARGGAGERADFNSGTGAFQEKMGSRPADGYFSRCENDKMGHETKSVRDEPSKAFHIAGITSDFLHVSVRVPKQVQNIFL